MCFAQRSFPRVLRTARAGVWGAGPRVCRLHVCRFTVQSATRSRRREIRALTGLCKRNECDGEVVRGCFNAQGTWPLVMHGTELWTVVLGAVEGVYGGRGWDDNVEQVLQKWKNRLNPVLEVVSMLLHYTGYLETSHKNPSVRMALHTMVLEHAPQFWRMHVS